LSSPRTRHLRISVGASESSTSVYGEAFFNSLLDGVVAKLERGAKVADIGCGTGYSTFVMARAFPNSTFVGFDFHEPSIEHAIAHARQSGGAGNVSFEVAKAKNFPAKDLDLVTCFDVLHDLGDPVGAATHIHRSLKPNGIWMLMEPLAGAGQPRAGRTRPPMGFRPWLAYQYPYRRKWVWPWAPRPDRRN
jgi:ubiquinone/menaquinone biosynthesis C-methylase UbiE